MNASSPCRILLVEDDPSDAHLVRQALRSVRDQRFDIAWVTSLAEARRQLLENPPEVLLLDLSLPDSSGLATVTAGRQAAGALPLIVLTGHDDTGFALQTLEAGAQDYLVRNPRFLNSDRHDRTFHEEMWRKLQTDGAWAGEVWNRCKNGEVFPEWQTVSSVVNGTGQVSQYIAVFADLSEIRQAQDTAERLSWRDALALAEQLRSVLREDIRLDGEVFHLDASIGIALFPESLQESASDVLRQADMAMHQAKTAGGGCIVFFETAMGETVRERYQLERELRQAVEQNQLRLYLQPQIDEAGRQVGAEALVRWQHPERGLVPPGVFIPLAETSDLIVLVDRWMLGEVCRLLARLVTQPAITLSQQARRISAGDFDSEVLQARERFTDTGMGLVLRRRIVEHHGGRICAESAGAGQGSEFIFEMPANSVREQGA